MTLFMCSVSKGQILQGIDQSRVGEQKKNEEVKPSGNDTNTPNSDNKKPGEGQKKKNRKKKSFFSISSQYEYFGVNGGTKYFQISSSDSWRISTNTASWATLSTSGDGLTLRVEPNPSASSRTDYFELSSGNNKLRVDITQAGETKFSISSNTASFTSSSGSKTFSVNSNASWQIKTNTKSWGHLSRDGNNLTLRVDANLSASSRTDYFELSSGNKTIRVDITQSAGETTLSLSPQSLNFTSNGGIQTINVSTNSNWDITVSTASWGHLEKRGNQLLVKVDANYGYSSRTDYFKISAGNKTVQVNISQSGSSSSSSSASYSRYRRPFNSRKDDYDWGFSAGYIQKQWNYDGEKMGIFDDDKFLQGLQAGIRYNPQFGLGFGMNTGLFYEYCWAKSEDQYDDYGSYHYTYEEHGLYMPLDFKYTLNFSEDFQLSLYGGIGFNYVLSGNVYIRDDGETYGSENMFSDHEGMKRFNTMFEYGAAIRISAFQIDFTMAQGLTNWSHDSGNKIKQGRPLSISASVCF